MKTPEDTWHVSGVHKRALKLVNFFVQNVQKPYMFDLGTHSPLICDALRSTCHIGGLWAPLKNCFMVLRPCVKSLNKGLLLGFWGGLPRFLRLQKSWNLALEIFVLLGSFNKENKCHEVFYWIKYPIKYNSFVLQTVGKGPVQFNQTTIFHRQNGQRDLSSFSSFIDGYNDHFLLCVLVLQSLYLGDKVINLYCLHLTHTYMIHDLYQR